MNCYYQWLETILVCCPAVILSIKYFWSSNLNFRARWRKQKKKLPKIPWPSPSYDEWFFFRWRVLLNSTSVNCQLHFINRQSLCCIKYHVASSQSWYRNFQLLAVKIATIGSHFEAFRYICLVTSYASWSSINFSFLFPGFFFTGLAENTEFSGPSSLMAGSYLERTPSTEWLTEDLNARCPWKLSLDEENNSLLRDEFFYEQVNNIELICHDVIFCASSINCRLKTGLIKNCKCVPANCESELFKFFWGSLCSLRLENVLLENEQNERFLEWWSMITSPGSKCFPVRVHFGSSQWRQGLWHADSGPV